MVVISLEPAEIRATFFGKSPLTRWTRLGVPRGGSSAPKTGEDEVVDMMRSSFALPKEMRDTDEIVRFLGRLAVSMADRVSTQLGEEFAVLTDEPEWDFGGYWSQQIGVHQEGRRLAAVAVEWSPSVSPTQFFVRCEQVRSMGVLLPTMMGGLAAPAMAAGFTVSSDAGLAGLLLGAAAGGLLYLAWTAMARTVSAGLNRGANAKLSDVISRSTDELELDPTPA